MYICIYHIYISHIYIYIYICMLYIYVCYIYIYMYAIYIYHNRALYIYSINIWYIIETTYPPSPPAPLPTTPRGGSTITEPWPWPEGLLECLTVFTCFYYTYIYIYTWRVHVNDFNAPCMTELCFDLAPKKNGGLWVELLEYPAGWVANFLMSRRSSEGVAGRHGFAADLALTHQKKMIALNFGKMSFLFLRLDFCFS